MCVLNSQICSRNRTHLVVKGLAGDLSSNRSPDMLRSRFASLLALVGSTTPFVVCNVIVYPAKGRPVYEVVLDSAAGVESLIKEFFKFTRRKDPVARPPELSGVSVYHSVTPGTRVRISLLRVILLGLVYQRGCTYDLPTCFV